MTNLTKLYAQLNDIFDKVDHAFQELNRDITDDIRLIILDKANYHDKLTLEQSDNVSILFDTYMATLPSRYFVDYVCYALEFYKFFYDADNLLSSNEPFCNFSSEGKAKVSALEKLYLSCIKVEEFYLNTCYDLAKDHDLQVRKPTYDTLREKLGLAA